MAQLIFGFILLGWVHQPGGLADRLDAKNSSLSIYGESTMARNFTELLRRKLEDERKFVCVGMDTNYNHMPESFKTGDGVDYEMYAFNINRIVATQQLAAAYKFNLAFYLAQGNKGIKVLENTFQWILCWAPDVPVILDAKFGDIGNTNEGYLDFAFRRLNADAVTVNPFMGHRDSIDKFLNWKDKGIFVLVKTSNKGGNEFQDIPVDIDETECEIINARLDRDNHERVTLYQNIAYGVREEWNYNGNCGVVAGATFPYGIGLVRQIVGDDIPILIPGIGSQGGDLEKTLLAGKNSRGHGILVNSSRGIIFADNPEAEIQKLHGSGTQILKGGVS